MTKNNLIDLKKPEPFVDESITDILRQAARRQISAALEAEIEIFFKHYKEITEDKGGQRIVRNGYLPKRKNHGGDALQNFSQQSHPDGMDSVPVK